MDRILSDDSDEELEAKPWEQNYSGKGGFVFLIDARKPMFQGGSESNFKRSFQCCLEAMLQIAREQRYDLVSVVLFGTAKTEGKFAPAGMVLLQPLVTPSVSNITKIRDIINGEFEDILNNYGHRCDISIEKVLNYCKNQLHHCRTKLYSKSIVLFTYDDNPHKNDEKAAHAARKRAEEIFLHQIELDVVGFGSFDSNIFYKELVLTARGELLKNWIGRDPVKKIDDVLKEITCLSKKFSRHYGIFYLGEEAKLRLIFYKLYHEPKKLIWVSKPNETTEKNEVYDNRDNNDIKQEGNGAGTVNIYEAETQKIADEFEEKKRDLYPLVGGEHILMSKKELKWFEVKVPKGLSLIGFKPLSSIPMHCVYGEPYFILPDSRDKVAENLFSHLLHSCLKRKVAPVCWYSLTKSGNPALVVLYPTEPAEYAKGKVHPHGFHLIRIPYADMMSDYSDDLPEVGPSQTQIEAANGIIKKTTFNWSPDIFSDSEYKSRIAMIEAIAMNYEDVAEITDNTDIDLEDVGERLGDLSFRFTDCSHLPAEVLGKRAASKEDGTSMRFKEPKIEDISYLISRVKAGEAHKLTVAQLREILKGEGVKSLSALQKPKLIAIVNERFNA